MQETTEAARPFLVTEGDAAKRLGIARSRLRAERRRGNIRYKRIGQGVYYNVHVLEAYASTMEGDDGEYPEGDPAGWLRVLRSTP